MTPTTRRAWLAHVIPLGALACCGGCSPSEEVEPPNKRLANSPKSEPPPNMKPQENFDPQKRLREKADREAK